mgnify:CR=1 FL=1
MASFLAKDALFVCLGGVSALSGLKDTILDLGVTEVVEAMDTDHDEIFHIKYVSHYPISFLCPGRTTEQIIIDSLVGISDPCPKQGWSDPGAEDPSG